MTRIITLVFTLILTLPLCAQLSQQTIDNYNPQRQGLVIDEANVLSPNEEDRLRTKLLLYADTTSTQILIVTVPRVQDNISLYAAELAHQLGVGQEGKDNGCIILVAVQDRNMAIQNGYGLEEYLTDFTSKEIIDDVITPYFRGEDYYAGLDQGTTAIFQVLNGTFHGSREDNRSDQRGKRIFPLLGLILIIIIIAARNRGGGGGRRGGMHGGYWIGGMGHGGFSGGSGFGGGGFGGGGASGSW